MTSEEFSNKVLTWFDKHGRKNLPWQKNINPYRVWLSEIMLQQTQVATVIPYFKHFMQRFPDVKSLASAPIDEVLALWSGLGYYARARNLHCAAQIVTEKFSGKFPRNLNSLLELPGVGRSTASAILSIAFEQQATILDGNVKRVLLRFLAIQNWAGEASVLNKLWKIAESYTPPRRNRDYTQAMMDLGATICSRSKPRCELCPLQQNCQAYIKKLTHIVPVAKPKTRALPIRQIKLLILQHVADASILLEKRPPSGIWGGLWSLPECKIDQNEKDWCTQNGFNIHSLQSWDCFRHTFSHFHLDIQPILITVKPKILLARDNDSITWHPANAWQTLGLPAPIRMLLNNLQKTL